MNLTAAPDKIRQKLSMLWIFLVANYLYCDVLSLMDPTFQRALLQGGPPGLPMTEGFLLGAGILMEIPMAMILISRLLEHRSNRCFNLVASLLMTTVQIGSFWMGTGPTLHYLFFSALEVGTALTIAWTAWKWHLTGSVQARVAAHMPAGFPARLLLLGAFLLSTAISADASGWETRTGRVSPPFKVPQWMLKAALPGSVSDPLTRIVKLAGAAP